MFEKNLKYYRLKKNMSMKDLADAVGVTSMAISNYESGKRQPDIDIINKMAEALGIKVVDFLASRNSRLEFKHCEFRKHCTLNKSQQEYIKESVEEYFSRFFDAVDCLCGNPLPTPPKCYTIKLSGSYQEDAINLRKHLCLPEEGPIDELIGILENKGIMVFELDIDDDHFSGMNGFVNDYPYIVINKNMNPERKRTTIIHELAHLMFIWDDSKEKDNEHLATQIAGAFLITDNDLVRELGLKKSRLTKDMILVCQEYGISMYLLVMRAAQVGIISNSLEKDFYIKANKAGWRKNEPPRVKRIEEPLLFKQLVYRAVNEEGISIQRGAELLQMTYSDVEKYCGLMEV
ncbi:MAG: helix-turn-helix domain-containing protein [Pseudobutyrivibrio ruminis]|uniref:Helix-turn-helix domain-containing protein n=1 Tax=Pseudobutyrivibrio ruminis TaxID=46206 RepID=A0A927YMK6_9FIRM|nr:helix-turn-helix domain-containing protein [Pseudobutyrivibrio ruminis]